MRLNYIKQKILENNDEIYLILQYGFLVSKIKEYEKKEVLSEEMKDFKSILDILEKNTSKKPAIAYKKDALSIINSLEGFVE